MRDCIFLLADKNMEGAFQGFFTRDGFHLSMQIARFNFDPTKDIIVGAGANDPGVYKRAHQLLRLYIRAYLHAIIVLDSEWEGSPGAVTIRDDIRENMVNNGWESDRFEVIVIEPELEAWILQDSPHVAQAFNFREHTSLRVWLQQEGLWNNQLTKCPEPKEAIQKIERVTGTPRSSAIYKRITNRVSIRYCVDASFQSLCDVLQRWFPPVRVYEASKSKYPNYVLLATLK